MAIAGTTGGSRSRPPDVRRIRERTSRSRLMADRLGRWGVAAGGAGIIAAILGILLFILVEVWPLFGGARVTPVAPLVDPRIDPVALVVDEYRAFAISLDRHGRVAVIDLERGIVQDGRQPIAGSGDDGPAEPAITALAPSSGRPVLAAGRADGSVVVRTVGFDVTFDAEGKRQVHPRLSEPTVLRAGEETGAVTRLAATASSSGDELAIIAMFEDGSLHVFHTTREENDFTGEVETSVEDRALAAPAGTVDALAVSARADRMLVATGDGRLLLYEAGADGPSSVSEPGPPVGALAWLVGERAAVVGRASGAIEIWFPIRREGESRARLEHVRDLPAHDAPIAGIAPSLRNKGFAVLDRDGGVGLYHSTSRRKLWSDRLDLPAPGGTLVLAPRANGLLVGAAGTIARFDVDNPHPEVSLRSLFGRVWYEGYDGPAWVWQSTGGTDDAEPKLSLTPLLAGTLKGTFYSLFLAIPIGVLGAMYASQFMHPRLRNVVKPMVEIMAALPSVVLGFLAGLWLAPIAQRVFPGMMLTLLTIPLAIVVTGALWSRLPARQRERFPDGFEVLPWGLAIALAIGVSLRLSPVVEKLVFDGSFTGWLHAATGMPYDQRNAVIVGIAMGFAVIPIIFSVSEDAFSNVPRSLVSGSLALGATRWQTVVRVVLPTASPGIFSAVMIGFGRAIGETMIVLMATGNTPIMSWFPFNGFRTLSANIAVEIPEAPYGGTLYRTLFLSALLLFALTFVINTVAEVVRQRLRRRFANI